MRRQRVLVVEDEEAMRRFYHGFFSQLHEKEFQAAIVPDGESALPILQHEPIDMLVLDWNLPGISGVSLAKALRAQARTRALGIIIVSAKAGPGEIVQALEAGADDHLGKPFDEKVLLARLRSLSRRQELAFDRHQLRRYEGLALDLDSERLEIEGRDVHLNRKELELLKLFLQRPNLLHTRLYLWEAIWGYEAELWDHILNSTLSSLRRKLGAKWGGKLKALRGRGYILEV